MMKITNLFAVALVAITMFSCSEENVNEPNVVVDGAPTTASIKLIQKTSPGTRATDPATGDESAIKTANIYIFKNDGMLEKIVAFEATDIAAGSKVFAITAGSKHVYAAINIPAAELTDIVENKTSKTNFEKHLIGIGATDPTKGFWMSNVGDGEAINLIVNVTNPAVENLVTVNVGRTSAKVNLTLAAAPVVIDGTFTLDGFKMKTSPKQSFLMPAKNAAGKRISPYYLETTVVAANYSDHTSYALATDVYVTENIHETPLMGNTTYAVVKGTFVPTTVLGADGVASTPAANNDFWRIQKADKTFAADYYSAEPSATEITAKGGAGAKFVKYSLGVSYYRLYVADNSKADASEKYAVLRNNFYKISIVNVNGAGSDTEDGVTPEDPDVPVVQATNMTAAIVVAPWNVVEQNGGI